MEKIYIFEWILGDCKQDPDPVFKVLICRIRPKMDRIRNPVAVVSIEIETQKW